MSSSSIKISQLSGSSKKSSKINHRKDCSNQLTIEDELLSKEFISPEDVFNLPSITKGIFFLFYSTNS